MKKIIVIILLLTSVVCLGDIFTSHLKPTSNNVLDIGTSSLEWRHVYGVDGTFSGTIKAGTFDFSAANITTTGTITSGVFTDGIFIVSGGVISAGTWQGDLIAHEYGGLEADVSNYANGLYGMISGVTVDIDTSSELLAIMDDETGTGLLVFGTSPTFTTSVAIGIETAAVALHQHVAGSIGTWHNFTNTTTGTTRTDGMAIGIDVSEVANIANYENTDMLFNQLNGGDFVFQGGNSFMLNGGERRYYDVGNSNYVGFEAPALTADQMWVLPTADGNADEIIKTDGSGTLSFVRMPKAIYAELSDSTDQAFAVAGTHYLITFNTNDELVGITHSTSSSPENITIVTTGVYTIFAQPQVAAAAGGAGAFHMWLQRDTGGGFADIANTNIELSLASNDEDVIPLATTFALDSGDIIRLRVVVSDNRISLDAQAAVVGPPTEPAIPSIIFTMFMIGS